MAPLVHASDIESALVPALAQASAPAGFRCVLEEQPAFLVPHRLLREHRNDRAAPLVVNPHVWFSWRGAPPQEIAPWLAAFGDAGTESDTAWVSDAATGALLPFWLGPGLRGLLEDAAPGQPAPADIEPRLRHVLRCARILVSPEAERQRKAVWSAAVESARRQYERAYAPVAGLLHPYHIGALRRYFRRKIRTGAFPLGDGQSPLRHAAHNEPVARFFHHQLAHVMSRIAGEPAKPSYVYFASYQGGAELERHTDREQCEFSITYCLDFTPEPVAATEWPILLDTPAGRVTVYQAIGDALLYRGCQVPHYRRRLREGATSSSFFFHFVRERFTGPLN
jgi:hypothetical protein